MSLLNKSVGAVAMFLILLFVAGPTFMVCWLSFGKQGFIQFPPELFSIEWYRELVSDARWRDAAARSMLVAVVSSGLAAVLGTAASYAIVRGKLPGRRAIELLALTPMIVPTIVLAVGGYRWFLRLHLAGSLWGLVLIYTVLALPFIVLVVTGSLERADPAQEMTSISLGAGPVRTFVRVTLPPLAPAIVAGAFLAAVTSLDEVVIALFLVGTSSPTLPLVVYGELATAMTPAVAAVTTAQLTVVLCLAIAWVLLRSMSRNRMRGR
jgi:putative spermidine/putrescine transport system permease protein